MEWLKMLRGLTALWAGALAIGILITAPSVTAGVVGKEDQTDLSGAPRRFVRRDLRGTCTWQSASIRTDRSATDARPATMIAKANFDGKGDVSLIHARSNFDGVVLDESFSGTYLLNPDGDGTITFNFANPSRQLVYDFQLSESRRVLRFMRESDLSPRPIGSSSVAVSSSRLSIGVCKFDE